MKNLFASRSRLPFWKKMFFSFLSLVVVSMLLLASVLLLTFERSTDRLCNEFFGTLLRQSNYSITYVNDLAQRLVSTLTYNYDVVSFLGMKSRNNQQTVDAQRAVNDLVRPLSYLDSVYLYNKGLDLVLCTKTGSQSTLDDFYDQTIADQLRRIDQGEPVDFLPSVHDATYYKVPVSIYSYIVPTYAADGSLVSAVVINVSTDVLLQSLLGINSEDDSLFLFVTDSEGTPLVTPNFSNGKIMPELQTLAARAVGFRQQRRQLFPHDRRGAVSHLLHQRKQQRLVCVRHDHLLQPDWGCGSQRVLEPAVLFCPAGNLQLCGAAPVPPAEHAD